MSEQLLIEKEKIALEREKFLFEKEKLKSDRISKVITILTIIIPIIICLVTYYQSTQNLKRQAEIDFELKSAEIIMDTSNVIASYNKAQALKALFPDRIPETFAERFEPQKYGTTSSNNTDSKIKLLTLIIENPDQKELVLKIWQEFFPNDDWVKSIKWWEFWNKLVLESIDPEQIFISVVSVGTLLWAIRRVLVSIFLIYNDYFDETCFFR